MGLCLTGKPEDVADVVLLTQDTCNVQRIARDFLQDARCYNEIRNMHGFTGTYQGRAVTVQGTGIGPVSAAMYAAEIAGEFGAKCLIKLDGCTAVAPQTRRLAAGPNGPHHRPHQPAALRRPHLPRGRGV